MGLSERQRTDQAIEAIDRFVLNAKPVPLTDQVRFDNRDLRLLVNDLEEALGVERRSRD